MVEERVAINICVVGASGLIGLRHTQHCLSEPLVNLSCTVDITAPGTAAAGKLKDELVEELSGVPHFTTINEMFQARTEGNIQVDGAIIATPNATHVELGLKMVRNGIDVLVEKPLSTSVDSARVLVEEVERLGRKIAVGHHRRFNPYTIQAKRMFAEGKLGQIQGVWTCLKPLSYFNSPATSWRKTPGNGGVILINLIHEVDLLRYLCGDIIKVYCQQGKSTRGFEIEETDAVASPHNWEGATGENPTMPYTGETVYTFFGTKGTLSIPQLKLHHYAQSVSDSGCWTDPITTDPYPQFDQTTLPLRRS
ncbi:hypothetical protein D9758_007616 [Tetrapyrgos nigripes]|uniref:Uncharacterized protein n=1 Tax=Tetrapyrgos nigripes TaxID=182062 RepID=A0A8H5G7Y0_9AGAR|nr:hypothetical protein D9758_007616 [Tetrapyrgos nigripes]